MKKVALHNLGCKVNSYETEVMQQNLMDKGFEIVPFEQKADVYIINTCSVTNIADRKSRQMLHRAKKENPEAVVVAVGCYVQSRGESEVLADGVDIVIGNNKKSELIDILTEYFERIYNSGEIVDETSGTGHVIDIAEDKNYEAMRLTMPSEHTRAYIKVQDGCNQFCSYCIIPYVRGRIRSRRIEDVVEEITNLTEKGFREFVLTGIHLSSFGLDRKEEGEDLLGLIKATANIEAVKRIRLGSLEPRIITREFAKEIASLEKVCPHFLLSLQSGCENTLKRMNRHYTPNEYFEGVKMLREAYSEAGLMPPAMTTDVIVGFPGESEADFEECRQFLEEISFYETHIFKYSVRKGTRAAVMDGQLSDAVKTQRSHALLSLNEKNKKEYISSFVGSRIEFLVEETTILDGKEYQVGYTKEYIRGAFASDTDFTGQIVTGILTADSVRESGCDICIIDDIGVK